MGYNGYTIATNTKLAYDPDKLTWWDRWGKQASYAALAVGLLAVSAYIAPTWIDFSILAGGATATLLTTATAYGFKGMQQGYSFWQGFSSYITHNWAQTYAIASLIFIAAVGVDRIVGALRNAGANKAPANAVEDPNALNDGLGTYGQQGGHHPMAKKAFEGVSSYNADDALTISSTKIKEFGTTHPAITGQQRSLYTAFSKTGQPLTMDAMKAIEIKAMVNAGIPIDYATNAVMKSTLQINTWGITQPVIIPWG